MPGILYFLFDRILWYSKLFYRTMRLLIIYFPFKIFLTIVLIFNCCLSFSTDTLQLKDDQEEYFLTPYIKILEDNNKEFTINQVSSPQYDSLFKSPDRNVP